ncbi:MAG: glycerate kinase, partial [Actinobacteria bacterium]|nr:glycerate kinase [Actinomycetota bacterium]
NTSGLLLLAKDPAGAPRLRPRTAHTFGTGQAIRAAIEAGARRVHVALGGSASSDGGAGILAALGARLLDASGRPVPLGNAGLEKLAQADLRGVVPLPSGEGDGGGLVAWTDVRSPLLGPDGAVAVFGPQKGLIGAEADAAERALARFAAVLGGNAEAPGAGAAGGAGFGLAALGAGLRGGAGSVAAVIGLDAALAGSDLVVTGEGSFDTQSAQGKVVSLVGQLAAKSGVPAALVAGRIDAPVGGFAGAIALTRLAVGGPDAARDPMRDAEALLREAGAELARSCGRS